MSGKFMTKKITIEPQETREVQPITPAIQTPETLIAQAIEKGVSVETMERLLAMRRELKAEYAKEAYDKDMALLQGEIPTIKKTKIVKSNNGEILYSYAPIESIVEQTKALIQKYGFSYLIKTEMVKDEKNNTTGVKSICSVKHRLGHSEDSPMEVPLGNKTNIMSQSQVVAAASTFAKRYAFCNAFGIMTSDEDNDGKDNGENKKDSSPASVKGKITFLLKNLGADISSKDKSVESIKKLTDLEPTENNLVEILSRLETLVREKNENA